MPTISTIFYSIDAGDWGIIDEFPYEQIFSRWWYFQSAESRGHLESVNPGSRIKCKMSVQGPEVTALSGGNKYHYSISDPISVSRWGPENNLIKQLSANSERQNNNPAHVWPAGPGDVVTHLHRGGAPEQREDGGRAPPRRGELESPEVPALTLNIGAVLRQQLVELSSLI